jgi:hypothetical protein
MTHVHRTAGGTPARVQVEGLALLVSVENQVQVSIITEGWVSIREITEYGQIENGLPMREKGFPAQ